MAPIHHAVKSGNLNQVKELLNQGVHVNSRNAHGWTPLHWAAWMGHLNIVQELLRRGAHLNPRTFTGRTPLHIASHIDPYVVHALLKAGANPRYRNMSGKSISNFFPNALKTSRAVTKWQNTVRKRKAERMLLSPRLLGSTKLNNKSISNIARYLTVRKKNNNK